MKPVKEYLLSHLHHDFVAQFGDKHDGTIQIPVLTKDNGVIEASYFYGDNKPKNIVVISSQIGCPAQCSFCELGGEKFTRNLTPEEIHEQVILLLQTASQYGFDLNSKDHKVTVANTGEPLFNPDLVKGLEKIAAFNFSMKVSTIFPAGKKARENIDALALFASNYPQPVQIQTSLISTSEEYRKEAGGTKLASYQEIRNAAEYWRTLNPQGRKWNLSLILSGETPCEVDQVYEIFPPELFHFRFRDYLPTENGRKNLLYQIDPQKMKIIKENFAEKGYGVGDWATPTPIEQKFGLVGNVTRKRYLEMLEEQ